ncbi:ER retention motif-containing protein [Cryptosporidium ubiquitum]|uniref:Translocation protein SEC62 n=1 Tax=Cryptosporidium ubiquitum TaxID=857276 RepID=A0A1J4MM71_9CRYT|nr:ER retention motif-containing protein [Cryptosporidium ubiquitum]OII75296.1 ER retention motif-containing protein [Cryptosporidium ubiquitum]
MVEQVDQELIYTKFVKYLLSSKTGVRTKGAIEVGRRAVDYFRGIEFIRWMRKNADNIKENYPEIAKNVSFESINDINQVGAELIKRSFIVRAEYKPVGTNTDDLKTPKWPKRLCVTSNQNFDEHSFYIITFDSNKTISNILMTSILVSVVALFMFPAWPLAIKISVWYISVVFLSVMLIVFFGRLIVFAFLWFFGFDFWILPNLFDEDTGVIDSFKPLYSIIRRGDDWFMLSIRAFCAIFLAGATYQLSKTHTASDVGQFARQSFLDVLDWGHRKISPPEDLSPTLHNSNVGINESTGTRNVSNEEYNCIKRCLRFESKDAVLDECATDCNCLSEVLSLPCLKSRSICPPEFEEELSNAMIKNCIDNQEIKGS